MPLPGVAWSNAFAASLSGRAGPAEAGAAEAGAAEVGPVQSFLAALPAGYAEQTSPEQAAADWRQLWALLGTGGEGGPPAGAEPPAQAVFAVPNWPSGPAGDLRLRRTAWSGAELSALLPVLESFGLTVVESVPWHLDLVLPGWGARRAFIDDMGLRLSPAGPGPEPPGPGSAGGPARLVEAVGAALAGEADVSVLNALVLGAGLNWREVALLSAYQAYRRLVGGSRSPERAAAMGRALVACPGLATAAVAVVRELVAGRPAAAEDGLVAQLEQAPDNEAYEALSELVALVRATVRTNWGASRPTIALKFASQALAFLPLPRPATETFVWAPWAEGLHLRFGLVARGGVRWSERPDDLRSEVLGLARAQVKKNSLIVPTGAKGGFVLRPGRDAHRGGRDAYTAFVSGLLDVVDDVARGAVVPSVGTGRADGDDAYLVVAPDKGTASFSDLANELSERRGFWLGDAFASGGSHGYDHKALGITARGAWLAARRHFAALGLDPEVDPVRVVGVGDMSGDVFGNGLLRSRTVMLVAAFDHRHVFVDPAPRPEEAYRERLRLFGLPASSWLDFDLSTASPGAFVVPRHARQVDLSPEAAAALGTRPGPMSPDELVRAVLRAPVDLLYFGGIGTFVKAPGESDADVDDRANDEVRVSADELRARVVVEGANLAMTERARTRYSRRGGRVNADFVDNAAGVAMSDREVNLKILLGLASEHGRLDLQARDALLARCADDASRAVLADVDGGLVALELAVRESAAQLPVYIALQEDLAAEGVMSPEVEGLPGAEELERRLGAGAGLSRPELAVLTAYARSELARAVLTSDLVTCPALDDLVLGYFPSEVRHELGDLVTGHPLRAQLLASQLANEVVARMGPAWAHELSCETGRTLAQVARCYWAAREVTGAARVAALVDVAAPMEVDTEHDLRSRWSAALGALARWYLVDGPGQAVADLVRLDTGAARELGTQAAEAVDAGEEVPGVPASVAAARRGLALLGAGAEAGLFGALARRTGRGAVQARHAYVHLVGSLGLGHLVDLLTRWPSGGRHERWLARALSDDLTRALAGASGRVLGPAPGEADDHALVTAWAEGCRQLLQRPTELARQACSAPAAGLGADIALASVAVRACVEALSAATASPRAGGAVPVELAGGSD